MELDIRTLIFQFLSKHKKISIVGTCSIRHMIRESMDVALRMTMGVPPCDPISHSIRMGMQIRKLTSLLDAVRWHHSKYPSGTCRPMSMVPTIAPLQTRRI
ncbi:hypothetical protein APY09_04440 [Schaalia odontolytica]|uniref:Uncharacterized protein n=1 Tax=Schaalia odontolytica TaxID=1660 RepID=A0A0V8S018_9ACTO|nr:hypothetical protein APY09_04440 [Schaalia odontolytica]